MKKVLAVMIILADVILMFSLLALFVGKMSVIDSFMAGITFTLYASGTMLLGGVMIIAAVYALSILRGDDD